MKKTEEIENLKQTIVDHESMLKNHEQMASDGVWITHNDNSHYLELQNTTLKSIERADKLQDANTELIKAIANLNGGVLKDLSETIVNLTKR